LAQTGDAPGVKPLGIKVLAARKPVTIAFPFTVQFPLIVVGTPMTGVWANPVRTERPKRAVNRVVNRIIFFIRIS
jgi:hypothetical protein